MISCLGWFCLPWQTPSYNSDPEDFRIPEDLLSGVEVLPPNRGVNQRKPLKEACMKHWGSSRERSQCLDQLALSVGELVLGSRDWCGALYVVRWFKIFWSRRWGFIAFVWYELTPVQSVEKRTHWCTGLENVQQGWTFAYGPARGYVRFIARHLEGSLWSGPFVPPSKFVPGQNTKQRYGS